MSRAHWTNDGECSSCRRNNRRCECGPWCVGCGQMLGQYRGRPWPERCRLCMSTTPRMFAELLPTYDQEADARRAEGLEAAVEWWKRPEYQREGLDRVIPVLAEQLDTGRAEGRRLSHVLADALERKGHPGFYPDARFACARFADDHDGDLELLVVSWFAANPSPLERNLPPY